VSDLVLNNNIEKLVLDDWFVEKETKKCKHNDKYKYKTPHSVSSLLHFNR